MAEIRAEGVSLRVARRRLQPCLLRTGPANLMIERKKKATFSIELNITEKGEGGAKTDGNTEKNKGTVPLLVR